jgi:hypothetical protein
MQINFPHFRLNPHNSLNVDQWINDKCVAQNILPLSALSESEQSFVYNIPEILKRNE